ncbi:MAG TPA: ATP-binding protein, partial [Thermodesulfobacteriota bacterium]|nr:ATP-binding protein [Thermodesulfobacteriota bacterium]
MKNSFRELTPEEMRKSCDPDSLGFETTEDLSAGQDTVLSQDRAVKAILFGVGMDGLDYNIFVAGHPKTGLTYITKTLIEQIALKKSPPPDWCYVHNFREPDRPKALSLPSGRAREFKKDIEELITDVRNDIPDVFESEDYSAKRDELLKKFNVERSEILSTLEEKVLKDGFILNVSQVGMVIMPARDGQPMDEETLKSLDDESKKQLREKSEILQAEMNQVVRSLRAKEKELKNSLKDLDKNIALYAIGHCIEDLNEKYNEFPQVLSYLQEIKDDMIMNLDDFKAKAPAASPFPMPLEQPSFTRYEVNLLVDQSETKGAPVIYESNPTYPNLFGSIERKSQFGALFTDFTMIRPGSLHKAN